ncbi:putative poly(A)-specific ribonuclease [Arabidopsis thaliana]
MCVCISVDTGLIALFGWGSFLVCGWDNRSKEILDNITSFEADFICLQTTTILLKAVAWRVPYGDAVQKLKCNCLGILAAFKILKPFNHVVIVATTHLKSGKPDEWNDVKLAQAKSLMFRLAMFKRTISAVENCSPSVILAGDFNSNPSNNIPIVWPLGGEEEDTGFGLCSAYGFTKGEPKLTKYVP